MPIIREYQSQSRAPGPINMPTVTADQMGAGAGRATEQLGQAVSNVGETIAKRVDQQNTSDVTAKLTKASADLSIELQQTIRQADPNDPKVFEDYQKRVDETIGKIGDEATSSGARAFFEENSARIKGQLAKTSADGLAELAGVKAVNDFTITANSLTASAMADPSSLGLQRDLSKAAIENLVKNGQLPRDKAIKLSEQNDVALTKASLRGWAQLNPEYAKEKLKSGEFDTVLGGEGKVQMFGEIDQAVRAKEIEAERRLREQEKIVKAQQQKTQNTFLQKITDGQLSTKDILNSNLDPFGSGGKETFLQMAKMRNSPEEKLKTNPAVMIGLFERIHLPDGDPNKLNDENELNQHFGKGLSMADLGRLRDEIQGQNTEAGKIESDMKKQVLNIAASKLTRSNPLTGIKDPIGDEQLARYQAYFFDEYKAQRAAGKSARSLTDPDSPDYLGKSISQYVRNQKQILKDMLPKRTPVSGLANAAAPQPGTAQAAPRFQAPEKPKIIRKDGESTADYLKRVKAGG